MLTVTLPVENGQVRGRPIAVGSGDAAFSPVNVANAVVATESGSKSNDVDTIGTNTHATSMIGAELECAKEEANAISEIGSESECATEEAKVSSDETSSADEVDGNPETIVHQGSITAMEEETTFHSKRHGFRLRVQEGSVIDSVQPFGPITVLKLEDTMEFEGGELHGALQVECLPNGSHFGTPLLFDFPVEIIDDGPLADEFDYLRYEMLVKHGDSPYWVRDAEYSTSLELIQEKGAIYVRARVGHFTLFGFFRRRQDPIDMGLQVFKTVDVPRQQRERHQSWIKNDTEGIDIHVFVMRLSRWEATYEGAKAGVGVQGFGATAEVNGKMEMKVSDAGKFPECCPIPPGSSHKFEIPPCGMRLTSSRKAAVFIATEGRHDDGKTYARVEARVLLRSDKMLTVNLPVRNGQVRWTPAEAASGGMLSQVNQAINNCANPTSPPLSTATAPESGTEKNSDTASLAECEKDIELSSTEPRGEEKRKEAVSDDPATPSGPCA